MLYWISSYPRSGNTLFRMALRRYWGYGSHSLYNDVQFQEEPIRDIVGHVDFSYPPDALVECERMHRSSELSFCKTHELISHDDYPSIYLLRDGRDAALSLAYNPDIPHATGEFDMDRLVKVVEGISHGNWSGHVEKWLSRTPAPTVVKYEDLVKAKGDISHLCLEDQLGGATTRTSLLKFGFLHSLDPRFFREGSVGRWRDCFPPDLLERYMELNGRVLRKMGYE